MAALNALPGETFERTSDVTSYANRLRLRRPDWYLLQVQHKVPIQRPADGQSWEPPGYEPRRTPEREAILREHWPAGTPADAIMELINATPGKRLDGPDVAALAGSLGLRRPDWYISAINGKPVEQRGHWATPERVEALKRMIAEGKTPGQYCPVLAGMDGSPLPNGKTVQNFAISKGWTWDKLKPAARVATPARSQVQVASKPVAAAPASRPLAQQPAGRRDAVARVVGAVTRSAAGDDLVAAFIAKNGVTKLPAASVGQTTAVLPEADRAAIAAHNDKMAEAMVGSVWRRKGHAAS